jgi:hypothetical protein
MHQPTQSCDRMPILAVDSLPVPTDPLVDIAAEQLYGWSTSEVMGQRKLHLLVPEDSPDRGAQIMARLMACRSWSASSASRLT